MGIVEDLVEIWPNEVCDTGFIHDHLAYVFVIGIIACLLKGPLVVIWILLLLLASLSIVTLCISIIFFFGKARKASLILRMFSAVAIAYVKDLANVLPLILFFFLVDWNLDFLNCSLVGRERRGGETFLAILLWGSFEVGEVRGTFLVNFDLTMDLKEVLAMI